MTVNANKHLFKENFPETGGSAERCGELRFAQRRHEKLHHLDRPVDDFHKVDHVGREKRNFFDVPRVRCERRTLFVNNMRFSKL